MTVEELRASFPPQYNLYYPANAGRKSSQFDLFIRILPEPASRLYAGTKTFELRKYVPRHTGFVFLFETGKTNAITGCFFFREFLVDTVERLWERVGTRATKREKFDAYFAAKKAGVAIEILGVERFVQAISEEELRRRFPDFPTSPEPYVYLYTPIGGALSQFLRSRVARLVAEFER